MGQVFGRTRHTEGCVFYRYVNRIDKIAIGKLIKEFCGNEGQHPYLDEVRQTTLKFLRTACSFVPDAENDGADLKNAAFILYQPGRELVIRSGNGDWEYDFTQYADGNIYGRCLRKPFRWWCVDKAKEMVFAFGKVAVGMLTGGVAGTAHKALTWF